MDVATLADVLRGTAEHQCPAKDESVTMMTPRPLGATGLMVTSIGLGLAAVGRPAYIDLGRDSDLGPDRSVEAMRHTTHERAIGAWTHRFTR
jgi:hypothetical protein